MGKDSKEIDRGKSARGECQEFERDTGVSCGCPPTRHAKLKGTQSSQTSQTSEAASTGHSQGPDRWKDESLGWFPGPKGKFTQFTNTILPRNPSLRQKNISTR